RADADAARAQVDAERAARQRAEADAAAARERAIKAESEANRSQVLRPSVPLPDPAARQKVELRMRLLEQLNGAIPSRDTPHGLVATIGEAGFNGTVLR